MDDSKSDSKDGLKGDPKQADPSWYANWMKGYLQKELSAGRLPIKHRLYAVETLAEIETQIPSDRGKAWLRKHIKDALTRKNRNGIRFYKQHTVRATAILASLVGLKVSLPPVETDTVDPRLPDFSAALSGKRIVGNR